MAPLPWLAYACLAGSMLVVGCYVGLSKSLVGVFPVFLLAWLRFGIAAVAMLPWLKREPGRAPLGAREKRLLFLESFFGNFLFSICMLWGVQLTSALSAGIVMATLPGAVALLAWAVLGERPGRRIVAGVGFAVAGVALLAWARAGEPASSPLSLPGLLLLAGAVVCEAVYVVVGKLLTADVSPRRISAWINLWGLLLITPFGLWQARDFDFAAVAAPSWALLVFYALAASVVTVQLWMRGLRDVPAPRAGVFSIFLPLGAAAVGVVLLNEPFGPLHALAFLLALSGLLLATWPEREMGARARAV